MAKELVLSVLFKAIDSMTATMDKISGSFEKIQGAADSASARMNALGHKMIQTGKSMVVTGAEMAAPAVAVGLAAYKAVESFEGLQEKIDNVGASVGGLSDKQRESLDLFAKQQSLITGFDAGSYIDAVYQGTSAFLSLQQAQAVAATAGKVARGTKGDPIETAQALTTLMLNFSDTTKTAQDNAAALGDKLTKIQTTGKWPSLTSLQYALSEGAASAKSFGVDIDQTLGAMSAFSAAGEADTRAGTAFREIMTSMTKIQDKLGVSIARNAAGGVDLYQTVERLNAAYGNLPRAELGSILAKALGREAGTRIIELIDHLHEFRQGIDASATAAGTTDRTLSKFQEHGLLAFQKLHAAVDNLWDTLGGVLAPAFEQLAKTLTAGATALEDFVSHSDGLKSIAQSAQDIAADFFTAAKAVGGFLAAYPALTNFALKAAALSVAISGIGGVISIVSGGFVMLGGAALIAGSHLMNLAQRAVWLGDKVFQIGSYAVEAARGIDLVSAATTVWTAAQTALDAVLAPEVLVIAGIAIAAAALAYEIYEHWGPIKAFVEKLWGDIKAIFTGAEAWMYSAGASMLEALGHGILATVEAPVKAMEKVGSEIMKFLPHSPAEKGPLADLDRVDILGEIVSTIESNTSSLTGALSGALGSALGGASSAVHAAGPAISRAWESVKSLVGSHAEVLHALMGTESNFGRNTFNPASSAIGPFQMLKAFRATWGVSPAQAADMTASTEIANKVIFGKYLPEFGNLGAALSAWHRGEGWVRAHGIDTAYVDAVMHHMRVPAMPGAAAATVLAQLPATHGTAVAMPVSAPTGGAAAPRERAAAGSGGFHVHYSPNITINGASGSPEDWRQQMQKHKADLVRVIDDAVNRRSRLKFEMD